LLTDITEILAAAKAGRYGVVSTSPVFPLAIPPIIKACEDKRAPLILSVTENQMGYNDIDNVGPEIVHHAKKADIPIAVILDHGKTDPTIAKAIDMGFNAIMFDGSDLPLEQNIEQTARVAEWAHAKGLACEGELGCIGGKEGQTIEHRDEAAYQYTEPETALRFWRETKVDNLAVAVGNVHGATTFEPCLDLERIRALRDALPITLGMHGSSGIADADIRQAIRSGISKMNFYSCMARNMVLAVRQLLAADEKFVNFPLLVNEAQKAAYETICACCDLYGGTGRATARGPVAHASQCAPGQPCSRS